MVKRTPPPQQAIEQRHWTISEEIDRAVAKLQRRISELEALDIQSAILENTSADNVAISNVRRTIGEVFGQNSTEFREHKDMQMWSGAMRVERFDMSPEEIIMATERGRKQVIGTLSGLIGHLEEKREELGVGAPTPKAFLNYLNLHPRIADVADDLFQDGYHWEAVFAAAKALVNYVKELSGQEQLDGAPLMRKVFSKNNPVLMFNDLENQTDADEQEGMMHLFEGVVLGIRNPGGHTFPEGPEQRAVEYLSLISLLAYRVQEAKRKSAP
jgi:uncharacterized protein (TIGR02391 family)